MQITGTTEQQLIYLQLHWGRMFVFNAPGRADALWTATARFGDQDELRAESATELLREVRTHYEAKKFPGS